MPMAPPHTSAVPVAPIAEAKPPGAASRGLEIIRRPASDRVFDIAVDALAQYFQIRSTVVAASAPCRPRGVVERLYRRIDALLYPQPRPALKPADQSADTAWPIAAVVDLTAAPHQRPARAGQPAISVPVLAVTFDGYGLDSLVEAVRAQIGLVAGTVLAEVWSCPIDEPAELLFAGLCCIDHRSLARSVTWVAAKLPALIAGALGRQHAPATAIQRAPARPARKAGSLLLDLFRRLLSRLFFRDQWFIELHQPEPGSMVPGRLAQRIEPPPDTLWADPFLIRHNGQRWLFFEEQPLRSAPGHIAALALDSEGCPFGPPRIVLRKPWHLSYPFIWQADNRLLMIPESSANHSMSLYESDAPTGPWRHLTTLMEGRRWADPTVVEFDKRLWLFASSAGDRACPHDELWVYYADAIEGPWRPHSLNPVKIDAGSSRPAGAMWVAPDGRLFRVAQDCSTVYGGAVVLLRIDELTPDRFRETVVPLGDPAAPFRPDRPWHTFNSDGQHMVIDLLRRQWRWRLFGGRGQSPNDPDTRFRQSGWPQDGTAATVNH
jgi:hypothetical protein